MDLCFVFALQPQGVNSLWSLIQHHIKTRVKVKWGHLSESWSESKMLIRQIHQERNEGLRTGCSQRAAFANNEWMIFILSVDAVKSETFLKTQPSLLDALMTSHVKHLLVGLVHVCFQSFTADVLKMRGSIEKITKIRDRARSWF